MNINNLKEFLEDNVPTFENIEIIGAGTAFHYTPHYEKIAKCGRFLGAPLTINLDKTQATLNSPEAKADPGVVFAYDNFNDTYEEGFGCNVVNLAFARALRASHTQEMAIGAPKTLLILNTDIISFKLVVEAEE